MRRRLWLQPHLVDTASKRHRLVKLPVERWAHSVNFSLASGPEHARGGQSVAFGCDLAAAHCVVGYGSCHTPSTNQTSALHTQTSATTHPQWLPKIPTAFFGS